MAEYYLSPQALVGYHWQMSKRILLFLVPLLGWIIYDNLELQHGSLLTAVPIVLILLGVVGFGAFRTIKQQKQVALSYRLLIEPSSITRTQLNTPTILLHPNDISRIIENPNGAITIVAHDKYQHIYIGPKINNREQLIAELEHFKSVIPETHKTLLERIAPFTSIFMIALMVAFYTANNKIIVGLTGFSILAILLWSAWQVWHNKNVQQHSRRNLWIQLFVILSILAGLIVKLLS